MERKYMRKKENGMRIDLSDGWMGWMKLEDYY